MTGKLYYEDSHIRSFTAIVTACEEKKGKFEITLDRTAFFPEGGGQSADTGVIVCGGVTVHVLDAHERGDEVCHICDGPLEAGSAVEGHIDWERRFNHMQGHSGEHILSGVVWERFGGNNVGFHMGADGIVIDFDKYISPEELRDVELEVNRIIYENRPVSARFPTPEELESLHYRSKKELEGDVRIVTVEGADACACCAPHVKRTGEVGLVRILESSRRKEGVRLRMLAGEAAFRDCVEKSASVSAVSALLSAKPGEIAQAVRHLMEERDRLSYEKGGLARLMAAQIAESAEPTEGNMVMFQPLLSPDDLRLLANALIPKCGGICALFTGSDEEGYKYIMASGSVDLRARAKDINTALRGRGGGQPGMIQGSAAASRAEIEDYFKE